MQAIYNLLNTGRKLTQPVTWDRSRSGEADGGGLARQCKQTDIPQESYSPADSIAACDTLFSLSAHLSRSGPRFDLSWQWKF